jgi:hypothetical protein
MFPPVIKVQWKESPLNVQLIALVRHVSDLREAGLKACHYIEEFHHR